jgi:hypothetical protein
MEILDLSYKVFINDDGSIDRYTLNDEPWEFVDPETVKIGDIIWFDPNGLERNGIVMNIRKADFIYYDVSRGSNMNLEEIAMFQVYKVEKGDENGKAS